MSSSFLPGVKIPLIESLLELMFFLILLQTEPEINGKVIGTNKSQLYFDVFLLFFSYDLHFGREVDVRFSS
jgi:hypothetical protein